MVLMQFSLLIQLYMPRICANFHMPRRLSLSQSGNLARFGNKAMSETVTMEDLDEERRAPDGIAYTYDDFVMLFHPDDFSAANKQWDNLPLAGEATPSAAFQTLEIGQAGAATGTTTPIPGQQTQQQQYRKEQFQLNQQQLAAQQANNTGAPPGDAAPLPPVSGGTDTPSGAMGGLSLGGDQATQQQQQQAAEIRKYRQQQAAKKEADEAAAKAATQAANKNSDLPSAEEEAALEEELFERHGEAKEDRAAAPKQTDAGWWRCGSRSRSAMPLLRPSRR